MVRSPVPVLVRVPSWDIVASSCAEPEGRERARIVYVPAPDMMLGAVEMLHAESKCLASCRGYSCIQL